MNGIIRSGLQLASDLGNTAVVFVARTVATPLMIAGSILEGAWIGLKSGVTLPVAKVLPSPKTETPTAQVQPMALANQEEVTMTANVAQDEQE